MAQDNILAAIDIGSDETKVLIAELRPQLKIIGGFCGKTEGMHRGEILNLDALKKSAQAVIREAERIAGISGRIRRACLSLSGMDLSGRAVVGMTSVKSGGIVSRDDVESAKRDAYEHDEEIPEGRWIVHHAFRGFSLDGNSGAGHPIGRRGRRLEYAMWVADASEKYIEEIFQIPNGYGMRVERLFFSSWASAEGVRTFSQMDRNRLVIDIGAGTTDFALFRSGQLVCMGVVPVGGRHITNDISEGLNIEPHVAECLKIQFGHACRRDEDVNKELPRNFTSAEGMRAGFSSQFVSCYKMELIIEARLWELFELVQTRVLEAGEDFSGTVVLTGGTSQLRDIDRIAAGVFQKKADDVRIGTPSHPFAPAYSDPKYATVVGLVKCAADEIARERKNARVGGWWRRFFGEMFGA